MSKYIGSSAVNLSTTSADVTGNADIDGNLTVGGNLTVSGTTITVDHATAQTVDLGDDDKIRLGDGNDLQIYHDGANNYIEGSTGSVIIQNTLDDYHVIIKSDNGSGGLADYFRANGNTGAALMYHYGSQKLATTSFGAQLTGSLATDTITNATANTDVTIDTNFDIILDAGGNVGVSVTDPDAKVEIKGTGGALGLTLKTTDASSNETFYVNDGGKAGVRYGPLVVGIPSGTAHASGALFQVEEAGLFTVLSSGHVGVGVTAPTGILSISGADTTSKPQLRFMSGEGTDLADAALSTTDDSGGTSLLIGSNLYYSGGSITRFSTSRSGSAIGFGYTGSMKFYTGSGNTAPDQKMTLDANGNLLVGTTSLGNADVGVEARANGTLTTTADSQTALFVKRIGSGSNDVGELARFQNADGTVGSIGSATKSGDTNIFVGNGDVGVYFHDAANSIDPINPANGFDRNGAIDLGRNGVAFKDLYLSGGIQFDSRSNKLDDYEEGEWTPTLKGNTSTGSATYTARVGYYTKIGNIVQISMTIACTNITGTGTMIIDGLPFSTGSGSVDSVFSMQWNSATWSGPSAEKQTVIPMIYATNNTKLGFRASDYRSSYSHAQVQLIGSGAIAYMRITGTYRIGTT